MTGWMKWALGLGCAACCAPLVLWALGGVAVGGWLSGESLLCVLPLAAMALWALWRKPAAKSCDCAEACGPDCKPS